MGSPPAATSRRPMANQLSCGIMSLRDRHETAQPGLRRKQIVVALVRAVLRYVVADRYQLTRPVEEEVILHLRELARLQRQLLCRRDPLAGVHGMRRVSRYRSHFA